MARSGIVCLRTLLGGLRSGAPPAASLPGGSLYRVYGPATWTMEPQVLLPLRPMVQNSIAVE